MKKDTVVTDGEKLKAIRQKYRLKQSDLAGSDITRNLLSEIETGKAIITKNVAEIVIKNLKSIANKEGFKVTETVEYLTENTSVQAKKILDGYITKLRGLLISKDEGFIEALKVAKSFLADWNINEKAAAIYELAGDYYYIQNEMYESIMYYEKALTAIGKLLPSEELLQIFFKITKAYIHAGDYNKAVENSTFVIEHFDNLSLDYTRKFIYNRAYTYYLLNKYERALIDIKKMEGLISKENLQDYFIMLDTKAVCLKQIRHYEEAIKIYNYLLELLDDEQPYKQLVVYINIVKTYMASLEKHKINDVFKLVQQKLPYLSNESKYEADIYFEIGKIYRYLENVEEANSYYIKAKDAAKKKKNYVLLNDILYEMMDITTNGEKAYLIKDEAFRLSTKQDKLADKIIHRLIDFYIANDNVSMVKEINDFALQFI